ncbi:glycosyltransferase [Lyngbya sp. PCC 8106]|uniref:glycosyltransferase n=1 Tax=Lyngbya sp. (strain PCC 8106) TaxID=313612 RepID=UPI0000EA9E99|nr:glycosyltransferase [Lyngbya sp. PCC 8106]EAW36727.1 Glycosyl transferase, group 1 [Lyngbya sp. PCC 8106]
MESSTEVNFQKIENLINNLPEVYQSIYVKGNLIRQGVRQNEWERLEVIKNYIKPGQTILDVGSNVGFFTIQLAKLFPENVFLSVEKQPSYAKLQAELLKIEQLENIILVQSDISIDWLVQANQACTYFDVTLLLSVLHHMEDAEQFLSEISKLSRALLIEMPHPDESKVCGKQVLKTQLTLEKISQFKQSFNKLSYQSDTHCDPHLKRSFYYADSPNYERESIFPYIGYPLAPRKYILKASNEGTVLHKSHLNQDIQLIPGVLLYDVAKIGQILYPLQENVINHIYKEFEKLDKLNNVADVRPWNLLFTSQGLKLIDYQYTNDLDSELKYDKDRDFPIILNYLQGMFRDEIKPKIAIDGIFFQYYKTGIFRVWKSLLETWKNQEFSRNIVVLDRMGTAPKIPGIRYRKISAHNYQNSEQDRMMLQYICDEEGADLFISTYYTTPISTPSVFMAYDMIPEVLGADFNEPMWREKHHAIRHASGYISISENTASDLVKCFSGISPEQVTVAHCGVSPVFSLNSQADINQFKMKYGITKPYFILVGAGSNYKNAGLFFQAFDQLYSKQGFEIVCTGGSSLWLSAEYRQFTSGCVVHPLQLSDEELAIAYSGAVALVYPSLYEGFGMPVAEAMACGCPVITCKNSSIPEVAGEAAIYVNETDINVMANALCEIQKPEVRRQLIETGLQQVQKFTWLKMADRVSSALINATLLRLNLREINLIIFPDWTQDEESLGSDLAQVIKSVLTHPKSNEITLLIDSSNISGEEADLALSSIIMNLMMEEELEVSDEPNISLIGQLSDIQWSALMPHLQGRIVLEHENQDVIKQTQVENLPLVELDSLNKDT